MTKHQNIGAYCTKSRVMEEIYGIISCIDSEIGREDMLDKFSLSKCVSMLNEIPENGVYVACFADTHVCTKRQRVAN